MSVLALGFLAQSMAAWAGPFGAVDVVGEYVLRNTVVGNSIVGRVTALVTDEVSDASYRSFVERMRWTQNKALRDELNGSFTQIQKEFEQYRVTQNRPAKMEAGAELLQDEREFLKKAGEALRTNRIEDMVKDSLVFVDAYTGQRPPELGGGKYDAAGHKFVTDNDFHPVPGIVPPRVELANELFGTGGSVDIRRLQQSWWKQMTVRLRTYARIPKAFMLSEGDWVSLYTRYGKRFTANDRYILSKIYRAVDYLSDYSRMRLTVRAFANEPAAVYTHVNEFSTDLTKKFVDGLLSIDAYVAARKMASSALPLNDIVWETEKRILNIISRCRTLGGTINGSRLVGGELKLAEGKVADLMDRQALLEKTIKEGGVMGTPRELLRMNADLELTRERLADATDILEAKYAEFVDNRIQIEIFANLRTGRMTGEDIQPFDMADPFVPVQKELDAWSDLLDRAMYNSSHKLVMKETKAFYASQVGETRTFIRKLNKLTDQVAGKRFTDTEIGKEFQDYTKHLFVENMIRTGKLLGFLIPAAAAEQYGGRWSKQVWDALFNDEAPATPTPGVVAPGGSTGIPTLGLPVSIPGLTPATSASGAASGAVPPLLPTPLGASSAPVPAGGAGQHIPGRGGFLPPMTDPLGH